MLRFYYNPAYKYTNRTIIDVSSDTSYRDIDYENIDSPDTINGHIIYVLEAAEKIPTYVVDQNSGWRWFVSGITQLRTGKFQISLLRDIVSESPNTWNQEEAYIQAGTATDYCKYKKWGLPFTNTKVGSQRLNVNGKSSFFVYYVNERTVGGGGDITESDLELNYVSVPGITTYNIELNDLNEIPNFNFVDAGPITSWENLKGTLRAYMKAEPYSFTNPKTYNIVYDNQNYPNNFNINSSETSDSNSLHTSLIWQHFSASGNPGPAIRQEISNILQSFLTSYRAGLGSYQSQTAINALDAYVDQIIKVPALTPGQYDFYKITRERQTIQHNDLLVNSQTNFITTAFQNSSTISGNSYGYDYSNNGTGHVWFQSTENISTYTLNFLGTGTTFSFTFKANVRKLPKSNVRCVNIVSDPDNGIYDQDLMQYLMLAQANPDLENDNIGQIIDIQYLPFSIATTTNSDFSVSSQDLIAEYLDNDDLLFTTSLPTLTNINKETDSIYIISPSRRSQFKFSPYNNDGRMVFNTKITLRPYQSIIYVRPSTQGLLLQDWDDKDCLVIQEDFSLTAINSSWANYVYSNRNYQNTFNLEVQTKEFERSWERRIEQEQAKSDEWNARNLSAQKAQTYTGNLPIISGIAGAIGTTVADERYMAAAALDREYNEALYQKSMEVARTQFSYQIDNIKSQPLIPNTITSIDCKMLDGIYLEFYSTNTTELNGIAAYYRYNGNRIDNYGTFAAYWGPFVRGKIIIAQNYTQPEIDELNRRLELGIFTGGSL